MTTHRAESRAADRGSPRTTFASLVVGGLSVLASGSGVAAADSAADAPALIEAEIVVTAPRTQDPLEVITDPGKPRQPLPAHDGADYLKTIPGFSVTRKGGTDGDPLFRGMAGSRVHILSDDAMLLGGCSARMDPPTAYVFPQNYDAIRVLKGPQSVRWGAGAAATVLFERADFDPADGFHGDASALTASWGRRDLAGRLESGNDNGYLRLLGSHSRSDDYEDGDGNEVHSDYTRWSGNAAVGWTPRTDMLIELAGSRSDGEAAYADRSMDGSGFAREALTLRVRQQNLSPVVTAIDARIAWGYVDHVMDNYNLREFVPSMMMPNPSASNPDRETLAGRVDVSLALTPTLTAVVGFDTHADEHTNRSSMNQPMMPYQGMPRVDDADFGQRGVFAESTLTTGAGHRWIGGLRVDRWEVKDQRQTVRVGMMNMANPSAGETDRDWLSSGFLRYEHGLQELPSWANSLTLFAGLGYSERVADYWERFGTNRQSMTTTSAFFTDPERTAQLDFGVISTSTRAQWSASLFWNRIDDYILIDNIVPTKPANTSVTRNIDARTWGGELEHGLALGEHWALSSTLSWTRGENRTDGGSLAQMPPLEARVSLTWTRDRLSVGGLVRGVAAQDRVDPGRGNIVGQDIGETDDFAIFSLNGSYRFSDRLNLSAGVDNLFDRYYVEHLSRSGAAVAGYLQTTRVPEPGRTAWLKLDVTL